MTDDRRSDAHHLREQATAPAETSLAAFVANAKALRADSTRNVPGANRGLAVLLTGKAASDRRKAAAETAKALGVALRHVDLSAVVSKYVGETEKNIDAVFDDASRSGAALFFDEADVLLGRRTEVKDAHDRYANLEVSYLLQKIEAHPGIAMLSSNLKSSIDPAIAKRLRYIVTLP